MPISTTTMCLSEKARNELERLSAATTIDVDGDPNLQTPDLHTAFFPSRFSKSLKLPESFARSLSSVRRWTDVSLHPSVSGWTRVCLRLTALAVSSSSQSEGRGRRTVASQPLLWTVDLKLDFSANGCLPTRFQEVWQYCGELSSD